MIILASQIVRVLKKHYREDEEAPVNIGSLTTLYDGVANLDSVHFRSENDKQMLLNPTSVFESKWRKLKLDISDYKSTKYFTCEDWDCIYSRPLNISMHCATGTCFCGEKMNREVSVNTYYGDCGVFTANMDCFVISDDLRIVPNEVLSVMQTLGNLGIAETTDGAEIRNVTFGFSEIMDLLKASLLSPTPLSDLIFNRIKGDSRTEESEPEILIQEKEKGANSYNSKNMLLRVMVQKSTNKLLFAQADEDFVDFLFSLLTIPLGGVECLLDGDTCLKSIDNLYTSVVDLFDDKYLVSPDIKKKLVKPKLPQGYMSKNQILPLSEQVVLYCRRQYGEEKDWLTYSSVSVAADPVIRHVEGNYVEGPKIYMVSDDLTVTPLSMSSSLFVVNEMKIPLSDVEEVEVHIGLQEGLSILKASLTSTSALTNGLKISLVLNKQLYIEEEH
ncbi:hypothetical protein ACP275_13G042900 [Erythranthe tilingii]